MVARLGRREDRAEEALRRLGVVRIATKYPKIATGYFLPTGRQAEIVEVKGSVELAPLTGLAEAIVDLTATGTTLRENGLVIRERIAVATARLIANPVAHKLQAAEIDASVGADPWNLSAHAPGDPTVLAAELRALVAAPESVADAVAEIIERVRASGDDALRYYTREFDTHGATPAALRVPEAELDTAVERLDEELRAGLELAIANVAKVAQAGSATDLTVPFDGHEVRVRGPVDRAGVYAPGGRAPYPTTVVMCTVVARVAGVREIAVCSPPGPDGDVDPVILAACRLAGVGRVYRMGGAQAIAALAYGTDAVAPST